MVSIVWLQFVLEFQFQISYAHSLCVSGSILNLGVKYQTLSLSHFSFTPRSKGRRVIVVARICPSVCWFVCPSIVHMTRFVRMITRNIFQIFLRLYWNILFVNIVDMFNDGYRSSLNVCIIDQKVTLAFFAFLVNFQVKALKFDTVGPFTSLLNIIDGLYSIFGESLKSSLNEYAGLWWRGLSMLYQTVFVNFLEFVMITLSIFHWSSYLFIGCGPRSGKFRRVWSRIPSEDIKFDHYRLHLAWSHVVFYMSDLDLL